MVINMQKPKGTSDIKIAQVCTFFSGAGGGADKSVADHIRAVQTQGITADLYTGYNNDLPVTPEEFGLKNCQMTAHAVTGSGICAFPLRSLRELAKRANDYDVIHLNGAWNFTSFLGGRTAHRAGVPYIQTPHSHYGEYHFSRRKWTKKILYSCMEYYTIRDSRYIHLVSDWEYRTSKRVLKKADIVTVPYSVNLKSFKPSIDRKLARQHLGLDQNAFYIISFGRVAQQKDPMFLLKAFTEAKLPVDAKLCFVGPCELHLLNQITHYVEQHQLKDSVQLIDYVQGDQKKYWLSASDVFALPTRDDNFCIAALEAAVCGTFCLVSPAIGVIEYMPNDSYLALGKTVSNWSKELINLYHRRPQQQFISDACLQQFDADHIGKRWAEIYNNIQNNK